MRTLGDASGSWGYAKKQASIDREDALQKERANDAPTSTSPRRCGTCLAWGVGPLVCRVCNDPWQPEPLRGLSPVVDTRR